MKNKINEVNRSKFFAKGNVDVKLENCTHTSVESYVISPTLHHRDHTKANKQEYFRYARRQALSLNHLFAHVAIGLCLK